MRYALQLLALTALAFHPGGWAQAQPLPAPAAETPANDPPPRPTAPLPTPPVASPPAASPPMAAVPVPPALPAAPQLPPPLPPKPAAVQYFYDKGGQPSKAVPLEDLAALVKANALLPTTLVWTSGMPSWKPAREIAVLAKLFPQEDATRSFMLGTWQGQTTMANGSLNVSGVTTYLADGTFRGSLTYTMPTSGLPGSTQNINGSWTSSRISDKIITVSLTPTGGSEITVQLTILDPNSLRSNTDGSVSHRIQ